MSKFESTFKSAIAENERRVLIDSLRSSPELSLGEILRLTKGGLGRLFNGITIADLMGNGAAAGRSSPAAGRNSPAAGHTPARRGRPPGRPRAEASIAEDTVQAAAPGKSSKPAAKEGKEAKDTKESKQRRGGKAKAVNTRTSEGRGSYDEGLFQAVQQSQGPIGAGAIIAQAGGSSLQARAGLARLIEAGRITWSGKARGTKYSVA